MKPLSKCRGTIFLLLVLVALVQADAGDEDDGVTIEEEPEEYESPKLDTKVHLAEHFDDVNKFNNRWVRSAAKKLGVDEDIAKYDGTWQIDEPARPLFGADKGLVLTSKAKHAAISTMLDKPFKFTDKPLIVQYEVTLQEGQECGGAYIKLLSENMKSKSDLKEFNDQSPYTIMFGPDKCGNDHKLHFIFRHVNPRTRAIQEKHSTAKITQRLDEIYKDKDPHLYTLIVAPDNTFSIKVDERVLASGSLLEDFDPPVNPPKEIDDPNDTKPADWDDREKIVDPSADKPEDWDENAPLTIPDMNAEKPDGWLDDVDPLIPAPDAQKPVDWDEDMDGSWEAPLVDNPECETAPGCGEWKRPFINNPNYKGKWIAPLIPNPNYKGKWSPRRIPNPEYFNDQVPFKMTPVSAVGFELWSISPNLLFDNLIISDDMSAVEDWTRQTFRVKRMKLNKASDSAWTWLTQVTEEKPWLWAVYVIVLFVIVASSVYLCCIRDSSSGGEDNVDKKKTDEPEADDEQDIGAQQFEGVDEGDSNQSNNEESEEEEPVKVSSGKEQLEQPSVPKDGSGEGPQPRKRKPRKE